MADALCFYTVLVSHMVYVCCPAHSHGVLDSSTATPVTLPTTL